MDNQKTLLITGGNGYLGSHLTRHYLNSGYRIISVDQSSDSRYGGIPAGVEFTQIDLGAPESIDRISELLAGTHATVIHLGAMKSVAESVEKPALYFRVNTEGTKNLLAAMAMSGNNKIIFASTAAVYGEIITSTPVPESHPCKPISPYAESKLQAEQMIKNSAARGVASVIFRFFNVVGAGSNSLIERDGKNLVPTALRALESGEPMSLFGNDYQTPDGTCIRDYFHILDLIAAHDLALEHLEKPGSFTLNLGSGRGYSVTEILAAIEKLSGEKVPVMIMPRREGDAESVVADISLAREVLGWSPRLSLESMISSVL